MDTVRFRRWELAVDLPSTREAYAALEIGWPEYCGCVHCRNFQRARHQAYPPEALGLYEQLGITPTLEQEVVPVEPVGREAYFYTGSFPFVGRLVTGADFWKAKPDGGLMNDRAGTEYITDTFRMGFTNHLSRTPRPFRGKPLVQLEFAVQLPWVIPKKMPDRE